jgi:hypothetical protein
MRLKLNKSLCRVAALKSILSYQKLHNKAARTKVLLNSNRQLGACRNKQDSAIRLDKLNSRVNSDSSS